MKCTNCGSDLSEEALFCPSCGIKVVKEKTESRKVENVEKEKKKGKGRKIIIPILAVAVLLVCVLGTKIWNRIQHPDLDKKIIYEKEGKLYYIDNIEKEKDPIEIYDSHEDSVDIQLDYASDQNYAFFVAQDSDRRIFYRVNTNKLTNNEAKNEKYIEKIDSKVSDYTILGYNSVLYFRNDESSCNYGDLYYYNGENSIEIDRDASDLKFTGDTIYYLKSKSETNTTNNKKLCYYNLKSTRQGDVGECAEIIAYDEENVLYCVATGDDYDICRNGIGKKEKVLISGVAYDWQVGSLEDETIYYERPSKQNASYYDFVKDPYADEDAKATEPQMADFLETVNPEDALSEYDYDDFVNYKDDFYAYDVYYYNDDLAMYEYYHDDAEYYIDESTDKIYYFNSEAYDNAYASYEKVLSRNSLREDLKNMTYDEALYDLYQYTAKDGEKLLAEAVQTRQLDSEYHLITYSKLDHPEHAKVCSIDDISTASELDTYLENLQDQYIAYVNIDGKEQSLDMRVAQVKFSDDQKQIMVVDESDWNARKLYSYKMENGKLKEDQTIELAYSGGEWYGDKFYYYNEEHEFFEYANGTATKIASDVDIAEMEDDGQFFLMDKRYSDDQDYSLRIVSESKQITTISDANFGKYINKNCIPYVTYDGDFYVYDGKESKKIDWNVNNFWSSFPYKHRFASWQLF